MSPATHQPTLFFPIIAWGWPAATLEQGVTSTTRIGDTVFITNVEIRITLTSPGATNWTHTIRWYLMKKNRDTNDVLNEGDNITTNFPLPAGFPTNY